MEASGLVVADTALAKREGDGSMRHDERLSKPSKLTQESSLTMAASVTDTACQRELLSWLATYCHWRR
jgi:hypothetical protein